MKYFFYSHYNHQSKNYDDEHKIEFFNKSKFFNKNMQSEKENILAVIKNLPNDASYDDIMEALYINHKINIGIEQLKNGNSLTISQLRERLKLWIE